MNTIQVITPLIGVVIGAALTGIGSYLRERKEQKRAIARALADLLEVRHHVVGIEVILHELKNRIQIPEDAIPVLRTLLDKLIPVDEDVHKRYDEAVTLLAGIDPLLAFRMRSKNTLPNLVSAIRGIAAENGATSKQIELFESIILSATSPALDEAVLELAHNHSLLTGRKVKKLLESRNRIPRELEALINSVVETAINGPDTINSREQ